MSRQIAPRRTRFVVTAGYVGYKQPKRSADFAAQLRATVGRDPDKTQTYEVGDPCDCDSSWNFKRSVEAEQAAEKLARLSRVRNVCVAAIGRVNGLVYVKPVDREVGD